MVKLSEKVYENKEISKSLKNMLNFIKSIPHNFFQKYTSKKLNDYVHLFK